MRIAQITSKFVCGEKHLGKWYCSDSAMGSDNKPVHRYLQVDGKWEKNTYYFDTEEKIQQLLKLGHIPDFTTSNDELRSRQILQDWLDSGWQDDIADY